ncbi:MAG: PCRF domain-containing protein, partial [Candidatus Peribacteraceae bacterium]|nr:PCRF domain-containing protein [Candidatus Peribacteraceae bacterium]
MPNRIEKLNLQLKEPNLWDDQKSANELFAKLKALKEQWEPVNNLYKSVSELLELSKEAEADDMPDLESEYNKLNNEWGKLETKLYLNGEFDLNNCYLTISAGAGGTEA